MKHRFSLFLACTRRLSLSLSRLRIWLQHRNAGRSSSQTILVWVELEALGRWKLFLFSGGGIRKKEGRVSVGLRRDRKTEIVKELKEEEGKEWMCLGSMSVLQKSRWKRWSGYITSVPSPAPSAYSSSSGRHLC